jgi:hypothetical protein
MTWRMSPTGRSTNHEIRPLPRMRSLSASGSSNRRAGSNESGESKHSHAKKVILIAAGRATGMSPPVPQAAEVVPPPLKATYQAPVVGR